MAGVGGKKTQPQEVTERIRIVLLNETHFVNYLNGLITKGDQIGIEDLKPVLMPFDVEVTAQKDTGMTGKPPDPPVLTNKAYFTGSYMKDYSRICGKTTCKNEYNKSCKVVHKLDVASRCIVCLNSKCKRKCHAKICRECYPDFDKDEADAENIRKQSREKFRLEFEKYQASLITYQNKILGGNTHMSKALNMIRKGLDPGIQKNIAADKTTVEDYKLTLDLLVSKIQTQNTQNLTKMTKTPNIEDIITDYKSLDNTAKLQKLNAKLAEINGDLGRKVK